jgi:hypothetical protein
MGKEGAWRNHQIAVHPYLARKIKETGLDLPKGVKRHSVPRLDT